MADPDNPHEFDRTQEEDHDLLTFGEAGLRLAEAVLHLRVELANATDASTRQALKRRIEALEGAATRNRHQSINDENFERFFGYPGTPRRNTGP